MTSSHSKDDTTRLTSEERDFVERVAEHYAPPPMTVSDRVSFDEALQSRLSRRRVWIFKPLAIAGTVAVLALMFVFFNGIGPDSTGRNATGPQVVGETTGQREKLGDVLLALAFDEPNGLDADEGFPKDYVAISSFLTDQE